MCVRGVLSFFFFFYKLEHELFYVKLKDFNVCIQRRSRTYWQRLRQLAVEPPFLETLVIKVIPIVVKFLLRCFV